MEIHIIVQAVTESNVTADTVIRAMLDQFETETADLNLPVQKGDNVIPIGEECATGDLILKAGSVLTAGAMSAAVGIGHTDLTVYKDLRVLFITSGQELVMPGEPRNGAQIYNSNAYLFAGLLRVSSSDALSVTCM